MSAMFLAFMLLAAGSRPAAAATISVGTFDPATSPFVVPIEITGAVELIARHTDQY
jgi:hypothetical protein